MTRTRNEWRPQSVPIQSALRPAATTSQMLCSGHMPKSVERDWHAIAKAYVFGIVVRLRDDGSEIRAFPSIRQLVQAFRIPRSVIGHKASREDWVARRRRFRAEFEASTWEKLTERELTQGPDLDDYR